MRYQISKYADLFVLNNFPLTADVEFLWCTVLITVGQYLETDKLLNKFSYCVSAVKYARPYCSLNQRPAAISRSDHTSSWGG